VILAAQMLRQQFDAPHRRPVAKPERVASQLLPDPWGRHPWGHHGTTAPRCICQGGNVMPLQVELDPGVDCRHTDTRQLRDLADGVPLGHPQHGLYALEEMFISSALERLLEPRDIVTIEAQFGWMLRGSHMASVDPRSAFFKKLLLTHLAVPISASMSRAAMLSTPGIRSSCAICAWNGATHAPIC
jgi:hypothetical protein